jgi:iron complex transport system ATP-binding protein
MNFIMEAKGLRFAYGDRAVIDGASLGTAEGEILGILGPNGAGKSTLLKLMTGLIQPSAGEVTLHGRDISAIGHREFARGVAMLPQLSSYPFGMKAMEVVLMGRMPYLPLLGFESKSDIEIARDAMERTDCLEFASRDINELSGGERQRVLLARAIAQGPQVLVLDEPTTFLDISHTIGLKRLIMGLSRDNGITVVLALHDVNLASTLCDRIAFMKAGKIESEGRPSDVIDSGIIREIFGADVEVMRARDDARPLCII